MQNHIEELQQEIRKRSSYDGDKILEGRVKSISRDSIFCHTKWIYSNEQLDFSNRSTSICNFVLSELNIPKAEQRQALQQIRPIIDKGITEHWNNVANKIKGAWMSKCEVVVCYC